jgi:hypothetical protein
MKLNLIVFFLYKLSLFKRPFRFVEKDALILIGKKSYLGLFAVLYLKTSNKRGETGQKQISVFFSYFFIVMTSRLSRWIFYIRIFSRHADMVGWCSWLSHLVNTVNKQYSEKVLGSSPSLIIFFFGAFCCVRYYLLGG